MTLPSPESHHAAVDHKQHHAEAIGASIVHPAASSIEMPVFDVAGVDPRHVTAINAEMRRRQEILVSLRTNEEGINLQRVYSHLERIGMRPRPIFILDEDEYGRAVSLAASSDTNESHGKFLTAMGVSIVRRDPLVERLNGGPEVIEGTAIHEGIHGTGTTAVGIRTQTQKRIFRGAEVTVEPYKKRSGYIHVLPDGQVQGLLIEEGNAEYERGKYVKEVLGRPEGFTKPGDYSGRLAKYTCLDADKNGQPQLALAEGVIGALILELLIEHDPTLLTTLREDRSSAEPGLELKDHMDEIVPGLYDKVNILDIKTNQGQAEATEMVGQVKRHLDKF